VRKAHLGKWGAPQPAKGTANKWRKEEGAGEELLERGLVKERRNFKGKPQTQGKWGKRIVVLKGEELNERPGCKRGNSQKALEEKEEKCLAGGGRRGRIQTVQEGRYW